MDEKYEVVLMVGEDGSIAGGMLPQYTHINVGDKVVMGGHNYKVIFEDDYWTQEDIDEWKKTTGYEVCKIENYYSKRNVKWEE